MKIEITNVDKIQVANLKSIGKRIKAGWVPTEQWASDQIHAQDSTLEMADIFIEAEVRGDVASHVVRATKGHPRMTVESHRPDWTGKPRPGPEVMRGIFIKTNPYAFIEMCRQRLCTTASHETRKFFLDIIRQMVLSEDVFLKQLGWYVVPDCEYRGGYCHKRQEVWAKCKYCPHWSEKE